MKRAICMDIEGEEDVCCCKKSKYYNQCCQECSEDDCNGCDYRYDSGCIAKEWVEE